MNRPSNLVRQIGLLLAVVLLAACAAPRTRTPGTIRLGYQPLVTFAPIYLGIERGYFEEAGVTLELTRIQATNEAVVQLAAGNFDVALAGGNAGVFNALNRGLKFKIVAPMHNERPPVATPLVISAKRANEITSIADLKGKSIGIVATGAAIEYWVAQALERGGLRIDDVTLKPMPFADMPAALESGSLDAAVLTEPLATISIGKGLLRVLSNDYIDGFTATYVFMGEDWMAQNPEAARGFLKGYLRAIRDLGDQPFSAETAQIIEKYTEVPAAVVQQASRAYYTPDGTVPVGDLATLQQFFLERGSLEYDQPLDLAGFVDTTLAADVLRELK